MDYLPNLRNLPISVQVVALGVILLLGSHIYSVLTSQRPFTEFPVIDLKPERGLGARQSFFKHGCETILKGVKTCNGPFQVITGTGPKIVVPNRFADELKAHDNLLFNEAFRRDFFVEYPGFESFKEGLKDNNLIPNTVRTKLTQSLGLITGALVDETTAAVHDVFGEQAEWHISMIKDDCIELVSRLSARVFLGKPLCRNKRWLQIAKDYTTDSIIAAHLMRAIPPLIRPIVHWIMPHNIRIRKAYKDARQMIIPEIEIRKERTQKLLDAGKKAPKTADTIGWLHETAQGAPVDYVAAQLSLTVAAIHTTSEALCRAVLDICVYPEVVSALRKEIIEVIGTDGWSKVALYKFRFMDSFLKESMRTGAMAITSMNRLVKAPIQLSDGTILPAGARIVVADSLHDPAVYENPEQFQADRFLHMREQPGQHNNHQHVSLSAQHMGFGNGPHACPGRFFASNEIKIALAHLLLKYDFKLSEQGKLPSEEYDGSVVTSHAEKVLLKRREAEVDLDILEELS